MPSVDRLGERVFCFVPRLLAILALTLSLTAAARSDVPPPEPTIAQSAGGHETDRQSEKDFRGIWPQAPFCLHTTPPRFTAESARHPKAPADTDENLAHFSFWPPIAARPGPFPKKERWQDASAGFPTADLTPEQRRAIWPRPDQEDGAVSFISLNPRPRSPPHSF